MQTYEADRKLEGEASGAYRKVGASFIRGLDVMVFALSSSVVDRGFESGRVKPKTKKLVCVLPREARSIKE